MSTTAVLLVSSTPFLPHLSSRESTPVEETIASTTVARSLLLEKIETAIKTDNSFALSVASVMRDTLATSLRQKRSRQAAEAHSDYILHDNDDFTMPSYPKRTRLSHSSPLNELGSIFFPALSHEAVQHQGKKSYTPNITLPGLGNFGPVASQPSPVQGHIGFNISLPSFSSQ